MIFKNNSRLASNWLAEGKNDGAKNLGTAILVKKLGRKLEIFFGKIFVP